MIGAKPCKSLFCQFFVVRHEEKVKLIKFPMNSFETMVQTTYSADLNYPDETNKT